VKSGVCWGAEVQNGASMRANSGRCELHFGAYTWIAGCLNKNKLIKTTSYLSSDSYKAELGIGIAHRPTDTFIS